VNQLPASPAPAQGAAQLSAAAAPSLAAPGAAQHLVLPGQPFLVLRLLLCQHLQPLLLLMLLLPLPAAALAGRQHLLLLGQLTQAALRLQS
jgi:hypothetical protein